MQPPSLLGSAESEEEPQADESEASFIGPMFDRRHARIWALVLQSQGISFVMDQVMPRHELDEAGQSVQVAAGGIVLRVRPQEYERALESIELYEEENENWPPPRVKDTPRHPASPLVGLGFVALVLFSLFATGPVAHGSAWFTYGRAAALKLFSEPWRMITALTLHADPQHVLGNAISGSIFGAMVARRIGPGGALLAILMSGVIGNTFNALHYLPHGHRSIGASTAVFGAVGLLAALQTIIDWRRRELEQRRRWRVVDVLAPIIGGLALLGALGAGGGNTDVWAHGFGFVAGVGIGTLLGLTLRKHRGEPSDFVQGLCVIATIGVIGGGWTLALL